MSHFQTRVKKFFLPSGKLSFPVALSDVTSSLARTALCAFSTPPSSIFPQKILRICSMLTVYSINIPKRHRKLFAFFQATYCPPKKVPLQAMPEWGPRNASTALSFRTSPNTAPQNRRRASLAATSSSHRWRRTPNESIPRPSPSSCDEGPPVRPYPAALLRP